MRLTFWLASLAAFISVAPPLAAQNARRANAPHLTTVEIKTEEHVFKHTPQGDLKLHFFMPPDAKASDKRPAILFFFGGGWKNGSFNQFIPQAEYFASRGLVAVSADYRIASVHKTTPDLCIEDAKSATRWLRSKANTFGIDPDRIVGSGGSAGGHLAAATALVPGFESKDDDAAISCKPNVLILFNPALNIPELAINDGGGQNVSASFWPTPFLTKGTPPTLIFFGTGDRMLPQGREFLAKGKSLGDRVELFSAAEQPHGFFNRSPWTEVTTREADRFLVSLGYLTGEPTLKLPADAPKLKREE